MRTIHEHSAGVIPFRRPEGSALFPLYLVIHSATVRNPLARWEFSLTFFAIFAVFRGAEVSVSKSELLVAEQVECAYFSSVDICSEKPPAVPEAVKRHRKRRRPCFAGISRTAPKIRDGQE